MSSARRRALPLSSPLRIGGLELQFSAGDLRYVRFAEMEIIRRIYFVARDTSWLNVPHRLRSVRAARAENGFEIRYRARSRGAGLDLDWECHIRGEADGTLIFRVEGQARQTAPVNRIGLCVHLPLVGFAGAAYKLDTSRRSRLARTLPATVAPHQPCTDIRALRFALPEGRRIALEFAGDEFELEDQRNWIDGSFKIYSRPLARGFPYTLQAGERFSQSVTVRASGGRPRLLARRSEDVELLLGPGTGKPGVAVGSSAPDDLAPPTPAQLPTLRGLGLRHLRFDLNPSERPPLDALARILPLTRSLTTSVELALFLPDRPTAELRDIAAALARAPVSLARMLVFHARETATTAAGFNAARKHLLRGTTPACWTAGTDHNFAELNRARSSLPAAQAYTFAANPQVHAYDEASMIECLEGLQQSVSSAVQFFAGAPIGVSPITLRPRKHPNAARGAQTPSRHDPRHVTPFAAAWTTGALGALQAGGAASATFYELTGPGGLVTHRGSLLPVGRALQHYLAAADEPALAFTSSHPLRAGGWARSGHAAVANFTARTQRIALRGLPPAIRVNGRPRRVGKLLRLTLPAWGVAYLDFEHTARP